MQRSDLEALTVRLHGLRLILSLAHGGSGGGAGGAPLAVLVLGGDEGSPDEPPPPQGVPAERLEELMPRQSFGRAKAAVSSAERVPSQCSVCLEPLEAEDACRLLPRGRRVERAVHPAWRHCTARPLGASQGAGRPRYPRTPPERLGGSPPWPEQLASGRPKDEFHAFNHQALPAHLPRRVHRHVVRALDALPLLQGLRLAGPR